MNQKRKLFISFILLFSIVSMTLAPFSAKADPLMLNIPAPQVDQLYIGDDYITGQLQQEVPMHYPGDGAFVFLNNKQYNFFDYTVENDTYFRLKLPKTLESGDTLNYFAITGNVLDPVAYPGQESYKMAGPFTPIEKAKIQVNFVDESNQPLDSAETFTGKLGENYSTTPKTIDGYQLKTTPSNATGVYTTNTEVIEIDYVYEKIPAQGENVTVQYIDEATNEELTQSVILSGQIGASYQSEPKDIDGYELIEIPTNQAGTFSADAQTVVYKYKKENTQIVIVENVTVTYKDTEGNTLAEPIILSGDLGASYESEEKSFAGYTLTTQPTNKAGVFTANAQEVNYVYTKNKDNNSVTPVEPIKPKEKTKKISKNVTHPSNKSNIDSQISLPKTGDSSSKLPLIIGISLIIGASYIVNTRKKQSKP